MQEKNNPEMQRQREICKALRLVFKGVDCDNRSARHPAADSMRLFGILGLMLQTHCSSEMLSHVQQAAASMSTAVLPVSVSPVLRRPLPGKQDMARSIALVRTALFNSTCSQTQNRLPLLTAIDCELKICEAINAVAYDEEDSLLWSKAWASMLFACDFKLPSKTLVHFTRILKTWTIFDGPANLWPAALRLRHARIVVAVYLMIRALHAYIVDLFSKSSARNNENRDCDWYKYVKEIVNLLHQMLSVNEDIPCEARAAFLDLLASLLKLSWDTVNDGRSMDFAHWLWLGDKSGSSSFPGISMLLHATAKQRPSAQINAETEIPNTESYEIRKQPLLQLCRQWASGLPAQKKCEFKVWLNDGLKFQLCHAERLIVLAKDFWDTDIFIKSFLLEMRCFLIGDRGNSNLRSQHLRRLDFFMDQVKLLGNSIGRAYTAVSQFILFCQKVAASYPGTLHLLKIEDLCERGVSCITKMASQWTTDMLSWGKIPPAVYSSFQEWIQGCMILAREQRECSRTT